MASLARQTPVSDIRQLLQECSNAEALTIPGTPTDLICLNNVVGLDLWASNDSSKSRMATSQNLAQSDVEDWIREPIGKVDNSGHKLCGKILVADQISENDLFLPPTSPSKADARFSRTLLAKSFDIPPTAIARLSGRFCWYIDFSKLYTDKSIFCEGLGTVNFSCLSRFDRETPSTRALIVFHPIRTPILDRARARMIREFEILATLSHEPAFIPYQMINLFKRIGRERTVYYTNERLKADDQLERLTQYPQPTLSPHEAGLILQGIHTRAKDTGGVRRDADNCVKVAKIWLGKVMRRPNAISDEAWATVKIDKIALRDFLDLAMQEVQIMSDIVKRSEQHAERQRDQAQNMLAYEQQKLSLKDARIGLMIAKATKNDGYANKSLAVVAMVYLPANLVASILSMPYFDWQSEENVVNTRLWVFFAVTIPLTAMTITTWWLWHRRVSPPDSEKVD